MQDYDVAHQQQHQHQQQQQLLSSQHAHQMMLSKSALQYQTAGIMHADEGYTEQSLTEHPESGGIVTATHGHQLQDNHPQQHYHHQQYMQQQQPDMQAERFSRQQPVVNPEQPHHRHQCPLRPFTICNERHGQEDGGHPNVSYCPNCYCLVCDSSASQCQGWTRASHCHAHDGDNYWKALRTFTHSDVLCNSPILKVLSADEKITIESHRFPPCHCAPQIPASHPFRPL